MSEITPVIDVPAALVGRLRAVRRRDTWMRLAEGVVLTAAVLVGAMTLAVAFDWLVVLFDVRWRTLLTAIALAFALVVFVRFCVVPLLIRRRLSETALEVDRAVPALEERWTTVTQLAESHDPPAIRGADGLIGQVRLEAVRLSDRVVASRVVTPRTLRRRGLELLAACVPVAAALAIAPRTTSTLLARFWMPTHAITLTRITAPAGDCVVPRGEPLKLRGELAGVIPSKAILQMRRGGEAEAMTLVPVGADRPMVEYALSAVQEPFSYRFRANDGQTPWYQVGIEERPSLSGILFRITPPAYSKLVVDQRNEIPSRVRALKGSRLEIALQASKPLERLVLDLGNQQSWRLPMTAGEWYRLDRTLEESVAFTVRLLDRHGLENLAPPSCRIVVYEDQPPHVRITSPADEIALRPDDKAEIEFKARDDLGVAAAQLMVTVGEGDEEKVLKTAELSLGDRQGGKSVEGKVTLDLKQFDLKHGQVLSYAIRVRDTRDTVAESSAGIRGDEAASRPAEQAMGATTAPAGAGEKDSQQATGESQAAGASEPKPSHAAADAQASAKRGSPEEGTAQADRPAAASAPAGLTSKRESATTRAGGSCNAGGKQSPIGQSERKQCKPSGPKGETTPPPPNDMAGRWLPSPGCQCSSKQRIKVDQWAGSYEGQAREKLQLAVDQYLNRLKKDLAEAEGPVLELRVETGPDSKWDEAKGRKLHGARELLGDAEKTTAELRAVSKDTPYAFVGLQLDEIVQSHVTPARNELGDAALCTNDPARQRSDFEQAALHIAEARRMLGEVVRQYEDLKRQQKGEDVAKQLAKMHQIFIEDMQALLKLMQGRPKLNPRSGEIIEVTDAYLEKVKEYYEQLKELLDQLAKEMAKDPDLLRRLMARTRLQGVTLRDQLTLLSIRQKQIASNVNDWHEGGVAGVDALKRRLQEQHARRQAELAETAAKLYENVDTWVPRGLDRDEGALLEARDLASKLVLAGKDLAADVAEGKTDDVLAEGEAFLGNLRLLQERLADAGFDNPSHEKLSLYIANRMEEIGRLRMQQANLLKQIDEARQGRFGRESAIPQRELIADTELLGAKLTGLASGPLGGLSPEIASKARELGEMVHGTIPTEQEAAVGLLLKSETQPARDAENKLVVRFDRAEQLFDDLLTDVEQAIKAKGSPEDVCKLPTLEELLKRLENEAKACEKLGAAVALNIKMNFDWMGDGDGGGSGSGSGSTSGSGQGGSARQAQRGQGGERGSNDKFAQAMAKAAQAMAKEENEGLRALAAALADSVRGDKSSGSEAQGRDWNVLVSQLQDELRQIRDHVPPEQYQQAIDSYFKSIAEMVGNEPAER